MEFVKGEPVKGPLPVDTALEYAKQLASALEAAHEKGIVHRDLKPANILLTADGVIKVLDFGLAMIAPPSASSDPENSPTLTMGATVAGVIMGTAGYMSPEQASGKTVDRRSDIWSFGVVVYELLTGKRLFDGETVSHAIAAVLTKEIDFAPIPSKARKLLQRCLEKDPKKRLRDIGDAPFDEEAIAAKQGAPWWTLAAATLLAGAAVWVLRAPPKMPEPPMRAYSISPEGLAAARLRTTAVISPDGKRIVYEAANKLWIRDLESEQARSLDGTDGGYAPFWAPDSQEIGFAIRSSLRRISVSGVSVAVITSISGRVHGCDWNPDRKSIICAFANAGIQEVAAAGGALKLVTSRGTRTFYGCKFLPVPGKRLVLTADGSESMQTIKIVDLDSGAESEIGKGSFPKYAGNGRIAFLDPNSGHVRIMALTPDWKPTGEPAALLSTAAFLSFADDGTMIWVEPSTSGRRQLGWRDRRGQRLPGASSTRSMMTALNLSPDGTRAVFSAQEGPNRDIWIYEIERSLFTRFTTDAAFDGAPEFSADGGEIAYRSQKAGSGDIFVKDAKGSGKEFAVVASKFTEFPVDWSSDGKTILFNKDIGQSDLYYVSRKADGSFGNETAFLTSPASENHGRFSPDGRFVAYVSDRSGQAEVFVHTFPDNAGEWQISADGGSHPRWSRDGKELFYLREGALLSVPVTLKPNFTAGKAVELFQAPGLSDGYYPYAVSSDGKRFLVPELVEDAASKPPAIHVIENWQALLKQAVR